MYGLRFTLLSRRRFRAHDLRFTLFLTDSLRVKPNFYYRYVDDIVLVAPVPSLQDLLGAFNSFHPRLSFIREIGGDNLDFLDLTLIKINGRLISNWHKKPTFSGRFLNFHSHHPLTHKRGTILSLIDRVILLSHPTFHQQNFDFVIRVLVENGYPLDVIFFYNYEKVTCKM